MRRIVLFVASAVVGGLAAVSAQAMAGTANSSPNCYSASKIDYCNTARIHVYKKAYAGTRVLSAQTIPGGYAGAQARLWKDGQACSGTVMRYYGGGGVGFEYGTSSTSDCGPGTYRATGSTAGWKVKTGEYATYNTNRSPYLTR